MSTDQRAEGDALEVVAERLREWQRGMGGGLVPTTLWIDKSEVPAQVAIDALRSLPVEQRMAAMGMVAIEVVADDGETVDVWIERGDETDGGY